MIFEITCNEDGDIYFNEYEDEEDWLEKERDDISGTVLEEDSEKYLAQFASTHQAVGDLRDFEGKILIKGIIIRPKIKSKINILDL